MKRRDVFRGLVAAGMAAVLPGAVEAAEPLAGPGKGIRILVDSIHAHNALQLDPTADPFAYHNVYGYRRAIDYLTSLGVQVDEALDGPFTEKLLASYRMLFLNLVSADLPPFLVSEISAIRKYLEGGGSLFVITDHSNCYYHAYKLMPLMTELGINVFTEVACDRPPATLGGGNGWIAVSRFKLHPVTTGLRTIGMETAGTVDDRFAIALTSDRAWGDEWQVHPYGKGDTPGLYGNWKQDPGERSGPLGVVLATTVGKGKVVQVADQNMFGDPFLNYMDNYRLWLNSAAWLLGVPSMGQPAPYEAWHGARVLCYERPAQSTFGSSGTGGYYNLFVGLGRVLPTFAGNDLSGEQGVVLFANDNYPMNPDEISLLMKHLRRGKGVVVLGVTPQVMDIHRSLMMQLRQELGPPTIKTTALQTTYDWPGLGPFLLLPGNEPFRNELIPGPETRPNEAQMKRLDTISAVLKRTMEGKSKE